MSVPEVVNQTGQVKQIVAQTVNLSDGGAGVVKGEQVTVHVTEGGIGAVQAGKANIEVKEGGIGAVMAQDLTVTNSVIGFAAASNIGGDAKILFDLRAGVAAGLIIGAALVIARLLVGHLRKS
jgi:hypothetical protein